MAVPGPRGGADLPGGTGADTPAPSIGAGALVYWAREGRLSVDLAIGMIATGGTLLAGLPALRRLDAEQRRGPGGRDAGAG